MAKVSVVIPSYNKAEFLKETMDSLLCQTEKDFEIIIVEDGSTDNSPKILAEYAKKDSRIKLIFQKNQGASIARNEGMKLASGEYLLFLDADDIFKPNLIETAYNKAKEKDADICIFNAEIFDNTTGGKIDWELMKYEYIPNEEIFSYKTCPHIFEITTNWVWNKLYKRSFIEKNKINFYNIIYTEDMCFSIWAYSVTNRITVIKDKLIKYRANIKNSLTGKKTENKYPTEIIKSYDFLCSKLDELNVLQETKQSLDRVFTENIIYMLGCLDGVSFLKLYSIAKKRIKIPIKVLTKKILTTIFSIKNENECKIISILGVKLKKKVVPSKKDKYLAEKFLENNIKDNSVLIVESNNYHGETTVGMAKYFHDLGFNVDVLLTKKEIQLNPFSRFKNVRIFETSIYATKIILADNSINKYFYIYLNSDEITLNIKGTKIAKSGVLYKNIKTNEEKIIQMCHFANKADKRTKRKLIALKDFPTNKKLVEVNTHYFGDVKNHTKNKLTNFIVIGNIEKQRKNHSALIECIKKLDKEGIKNFKVTVIARIGNLKKLDDDILKYLDFKGNVDYETMYYEIENADYILTLLDPENKTHERYIKNGASGSFQLIYGFKIPPLIPFKFASFWGFDDNNSILYKNNEELYLAMKNAINLSDESYKFKKENLDLLAKGIYQKSLNNLKGILK